MPYTATRRAMLSPPATGSAAPAWVATAQSLFNGVSAYDFRGAASVAAATFAGTSSIVAGGTNLDANGLVCAADTAIDTERVMSQDSIMVLLIHSEGTTALNKYPAGIGVVDGSWKVWRFATRSDNNLTATNGPNHILNADAGFVAMGPDGAFLNGVRFDSNAASTYAYSAGQTVFIGAMNYLGGSNNPYTGTISAVMLADSLATGTMDDAMSSLYTAMTS